ncbi:MAG: hypothetical protein QM784_28135 [Polyangiaceae bacterium]
MGRAPVSCGAPFVSIQTPDSKRKEYFSYGLNGWRLSCKGQCQPKG